MEQGVDDEAGCGTVLVVVGEACVVRTDSEAVNRAALGSRKRTEIELVAGFLVRLRRHIVDELDAALVAQAVPEACGVLRRVELARQEQLVTTVERHVGGWGVPPGGGRRPEICAVDDGADSVRHAVQLGDGGTVGRVHVGAEAEQADLGHRHTLRAHKRSGVLVCVA